MDLQLNGKRALVTGSSAGIGLGIATGLAREGAAVTLNGRDAARVDAARENRVLLAERRLAMPVLVVGAGLHVGEVDVAAAVRPHAETVVGLAAPTGAFHRRGGSRLVRRHAAGVPRRAGRVVRTFVVGATGLLGGAVARHLAALGDDVTGLVRSDEAKGRLGDGVTPVLGDLEDRLADVVRACRDVDAVVFAPQLSPDTEYDAVSDILDALAGTQKAFVFTSGTGVLLQRTWGAWSQDCVGEDDTFEPEPLAVRRVDTENLVRASADRGIRTIVLRLPMIWGPGDRGHVSQVYGSVASTGAACYIGEGLNSYSNLHIDDAARLYEAALRRGTPGALHHAVAGEVPVRWIAEAVARDLGCPTRSLSRSESIEVGASSAP